MRFAGKLLNIPHNLNYIKGIRSKWKLLVAILLGYLPLQDPDFLELQRVLDPSLEACSKIKTSPNH